MVATQTPKPALHINRAVPNVEGYFPLNEPKIGTPEFPGDVVHNHHVPKLFTPLKMRDVEFKNRIFVSPMCQYSALNGKVGDWHLVHLGGFAIRGAGAVMVEATAVTPEGRISPECPGIWSDDHIEPLRRIVNFVHAQGSHIGIQLAHAGRKASTYAPWVQLDIMGNNRTKNHSSVASVEEGGWPEDVIGPSDIPFSGTYPKPRTLTLEEIQGLEEAYAQAVERCKKIGFDFIEIHLAHGYLGHNFYSPLSNNRTDTYGGSLENRLRFPLQIAKRIRKEWGSSLPIFARLSATDWAEGPERDENTGEWLQWGIEQTKILSERLIEEAGVDLIDVSSGGNWVKQKIPVGPGYQVPFASALKSQVPALKGSVGAVGLITDPQQAEQILVENKADVIFLARELLRRADWPLYAAEQLGVVVKPPNQYERAWTRMLRGTKMQ